MVVEDQPLHRKMFKAWLTSAGFQTIMVSDERTAQGVATEQSPDIALIDIRLPHISGLDIIERLKGTAATANIPVMAVTVLSTRSDEAACYAAGADHFMTKPTNMHLLTEAIVSLVGASASSTQLNVLRPEGQ
jgi:DNA-binding response OmpR family regulator